MRAKSRQLPGAPGEGWQAPTESGGRNHKRAPWSRRDGEMVNPRVREFFGLPALEGAVCDQREGDKLVVTTDPVQQPLRLHAGGIHRIRGHPPVSPLLHTPLMSLTNALDAIAVVGAIILAGEHKARWRRCWAPSPSSPPPATSSAASSSPTACSRCSNPAARKTMIPATHIIEIDLPHRRRRSSSCR
jgi:hypothetical protein